MKEYNKLNNQLKLPVFWTSRLVCLKFNTQTMKLNFFLFRYFFSFILFFIIVWAYLCFIFYAFAPSQSIKLQIMQKPRHLTKYIRRGPMLSLMKSLNWPTFTQLIFAICRLFVLRKGAMLIQMKRLNASSIKLTVTILVYYLLYMYVFRLPKDGHLSSMLGRVLKPVY